MSLPVGWPPQSEVETLPTIWLALDGSQWPPAVGDRDAGVAPVSQWQVDRELVGSTLPGNIRARSGLSVGTASAEIAQNVKALTPWALTASQRVQTGSKADLYATHDGWDSGARIDFGNWRVAPTSGALLAPGVSVELVERQYEGRVQEHRMPALDMPQQNGQNDPAWWISRLARQMDYHLTPPPAPSTVLSIPLTGSGSMERPLVRDSQTWNIPVWGNDLGMVCPEPGDWLLYVDPKYIAIPLVSSKLKYYVTVNVSGQTVLLLDQGHALRFDPAAQTVSVTNDTNNFTGPGPGWVAASYTPGLDANHPNRVQVEVTRTLNGAGTSWTSCAIRVRSAHGAAWSSTATSSDPLAYDELSATFQIVSGNGLTEIGSMTGLQLSLEADPELFAAPDKPIKVPSLGGIIYAPYLPPGADAWTAIQEVCAAWAAACVVDTNGAMTVLTNDQLNGIDIPVTTVDVGTTFEDLAWSLDPADTGDRLEVTFNPPSREYYVAGQGSPILWQATEVIEVPPNKSIVVEANLDRAGAALLRWFPAWGISYQTNTWSAFTTADASGSHVADDALDFKTQRISASLVRITITNTLNQRVYMIDANQEPCLILRAPQVASFETQQIVSRGVSAINATNPVAVDLGFYVQRSEDAEAIADYIWARVSTPMWKASSVRTRLDYEHDIGRVLRLKHPATELDVKALVTKVSWSGQAGEIQQSLDLVLLSPTWTDFDETWAPFDWDDFDARWAGKTWNDFDINPTGGP